MAEFTSFLFLLCSYPSFKRRSRIMLQARSRYCVSTGKTEDSSKVCSRQVYAHIISLLLPFMPLVEETNDLSCNVLASCLLVVHNTSRCCKNHVSELTRWEKLDNPLLEIAETDVISWRDDTSLVEAAVQLDDNLARSVVIDLLEFANITVLLHNA